MRREYIGRMRVRYRAMKSKKARGRILDDFCATTERERKHAIKVLRSSSEPLKRSGRKAVYGSEVAEALRDIWLEAVQPCSKLMHPMMECYVISYEKMKGPFDPGLRGQLLKVSASSIDRLLKPKRLLSPPRRRSPMGVAAVKKEVPIRAGEWDVKELIKRMIMRMWSKRMALMCVDCWGIIESTIRNVSRLSIKRSADGPYGRIYTARR